MRYIVTIRTDKPEAEVGIYNEAGAQLSYNVWHAHRELSKTLLGVIRDELAKQQAGFDAISSVLVFQGPGSFTGLRIGITVANALSYGLSVPIVGVSGEHEWLERGIRRIKDGENDTLVLPEYGAEAHITQQKR